LNNSKPGYTSYDLDAGEVKKIKSDIAETQDIRKVSFSGGEPLLYLEAIAEIVSASRTLVRKDPVLFAITTNGSLIKRFADKIFPLGIDFCTLSFDSAHEKFLSRNFFEDCIDQAKTLFKKVEITFVYNTLQEMEIIKEIALRKSVRVTFNKQIRSGRSKIEENSENSNSFVCPNMSRDNFLKVTYVPKNGYSICCGPVVFDKLAPEDFTFTNDISRITESGLYRFLSQMSQGHFKFTSDIDCNNCRNLLKEHKPTY